MRLITSLLFAIGILYGGWWLFENNDFAHDLIGTNFLEQEVLTLEARYSPDYIIERHGRELLGDDRYMLAEPELKFYPYLMMEVKFSTPDKQTREGVILWGMEDGEMVINTETWETTHGFDDCIAANASRSDFRIVRALASHKNSMTREELMRFLAVEPEVLDDWIESAHRKKLIVQRGNSYYLHFQNPKLQVPPQTKFTQYPVTKPHKHTMRMTKRFSKGQIERTAQAAFSNDFSIRNSREVFIPVYMLAVLNPDGSVRTTYWNALTAQRIYPRYLSNSM